MSNKRDLDTSTFDSSSPSIQKPIEVKHKKVKFVTEPSRSSQKRSKPSDETLTGADDDDLEFDELNRVGKIIKGRVKNEGYDSDSSTENADVREEKKTKAEGGEDEDMFGVNEDLSINQKKSSKLFEKVDVGMDLKSGADGKEFLDLGDIVGQEFGKEEEGEEGEEEMTFKKKKKNLDQTNEESEEDSIEGYSDEEEDFVPGDEFANADDAPRARRKSKKGMGFMLSKFNMAEELTEGRMAADGSYVASSKDPEASHDNWLEGVDSKKAMKQAREAKRRLEEDIQKKAAMQDQQALLRTRKDCYISLLSFLSAQNGRSVSQTLSQLGIDKRSHQQTENIKKKKVMKRTVIDELVPESIIKSDTTDHDKGKGKESKPESKKSDQEIQIEIQIAEITDLASTLMGTHGELDVYDMSHGTITGILKSEGLVPRNWVPPSNDHTSTDTSSRLIPSSNPSATRKPLIARPSTTAPPPPPPTSALSLFYRFKPDPNNPSTLMVPPQIYGPFDRLTMQSWATQGFFGPYAQGVDIKEDITPHGANPWLNWSQIFQ